MTIATKVKSPQRQMVSDQNLLKLHQAYREFMQTRPWRELNDRNLLLFNHSDPDLQACGVVMGHWGVEHGLAAYTGALATDVFTRLALGDDGDQAQRARSIAATTGHKSLVSGDELRRIHRMGIKYRGNDNYPVWFARNPGEDKTRRIDDQEAAMLADWLTATVGASHLIRTGTLRTTTMDLLASDNRTFHPIECVKLPDGSWQYAASTMRKPG